MFSFFSHPSKKPTEIEPPDTTKPPATAVLVTDEQKTPGPKGPTIYRVNESTEEGAAVFHRPAKG